MTTETRPSLISLFDWVAANDDHAAHRVPLLGRAGRLLEGAEQALPDERRELATKLERWRYQHLNEHRDQMRDEDRWLVDALDLAANELSNRDARPPRATRAAVENRSDKPAVDVEACLDNRVDLEAVIHRATEVTQVHFGVSVRPGDPSAVNRRMLLYAPLYTSSYCVNDCTYCGFRYPNEIQRDHLSPDRVMTEADVLLARGLRHLLVVAGDFPSKTTNDYYAEILRGLVDRGAEPAVEIAPQSTDEYARLVAAGAVGVTLYQETYDERLYAQYHVRGPKRSFDWRLEGLDRAAEAGMKRLGLGVLLGLSDPGDDLAALMRHGRYVQARFPDCTMAFSLPRITEAPEEFETAFPVDDATFVRFYCALRIAFPRAELVLSTRESVAMRDRLARICITQMSAGSCTSPGGYETNNPDDSSKEQFPIHDHRTAATVAEWLEREGFQATYGI